MHERGAQSQEYFDNSLFRLLGDATSRVTRKRSKASVAPVPVPPYYRICTRRFTTTRDISTVLSLSPLPAFFSSKPEHTPALSYGPGIAPRGREYIYVYDEERFDPFNSPSPSPHILPSLYFVLNLSFSLLSAVLWPFGLNCNYLYCPMMSLFTSRRGHVYLSDWKEPQNKNAKITLR